MVGRDPDIVCALPLDHERAEYWVKYTHRAACAETQRAANDPTCLAGMHIDVLVVIGSWNVHA